MSLNALFKHSLIAFLFFVSGNFAFSQDISYNFIATGQLRENPSPDYYASDRILVSPGKTNASIGLGLQGKRLIKPKGKIALEAGILFYRHTVSYTRFNVVSNTQQIEVLDFGKTRNNTSNLLSFPIRLFYHPNAAGKTDTRGGVYIGPSLNFEHFSFDDDVSIGIDNRFFLDFQIGARAGKRKVYFDLNLFFQAYSSATSDLSGDKGISLSVGYRFR